MTIKKCYGKTKAYVLFSLRRKIEMIITVTRKRKEKAVF